MLASLAALLAQACAGAVLPPRALGWAASVPRPAAHEPAWPLTGGGMQEASLRVALDSFALPALQHDFGARHCGECEVLQVGGGAPTHHTPVLDACQHLRPPRARLLTASRKQRLLRPARLQQRAHC